MSAGDELIGRCVGPFRIESSLGDGGMGVVMRARDALLGREVALKLLLPELARHEDAARRLVREARHASSIVHPNVVTVLDVARSEGLIWVAMELVQGPPLSAILRDGPLSGGAALAIAIDVAEGLAAAHARSIAHRDLKPGNVLVDPQGRAMLVDFGLAKIVAGYDASDGPTVDQMSGSLTGPGELVGTPAYMSPEQARAEDVDLRTDVFSFGVVLYQMLTGDAPFRRPSPLATLTAIVDDAVPPLADQELARAFGPVLDRCLRKDRCERYDDAAALARALHAVDLVCDPTEILRRRAAAAPRSSEPPAASPSTRLGTPRVLGRGEELSDLERAMELGRRVVAIVGPCGIGKSYLASEHVRRRWATSVHVSLAHHDLQRSLSTALRLEGDDPDVIGEALDARGLALVIADDAERLAHAGVEALSRVRARAPSVTFLLTSRVLLPVAEHALALGPLGAQAAGTLLAGRLRAHGHAIDLVDAEVLARRLGGNPGAIEEAAALVHERGWDALDLELALLEDAGEAVTAERLARLRFESLPARMQRTLALLAAVLPADEEAAQAALDEGETITAPIAAGLVREARQGLVIAGAMREVARAAASSDIVQIAVERVERRALREPAPVEADQDGSGIP